MPPKTLHLYHKLEEQQMDIINSVADLDKHVITYRLFDNKWHILEIIQHLVMSENLSLIYLRKKWKYTQNLPPKTFITDFRSWLLLFFMWFPIPLKAPARVIVFDPDKTGSELIREWGQTRTQMKNFLEEMDLDVFQKEFYKHPAVGKLTLHHMLQFFYAHIKRHKKQIQRILLQIHTKSQDRL